MHPAVQWTNERGTISFRSEWHGNRAVTIDHKPTNKSTGYFLYNQHERLSGPKYQLCMILGLWQDQASRHLQSFSFPYCWQISVYVKAIRERHKTSIFYGPICESKTGGHLCEQIFTPNHCKSVCLCVYMHSVCESCGPLWQSYYGDSSGSLRGGHLTFPALKEGLNLSSQLLQTCFRQPH